MRLRLPSLLLMVLATNVAAGPAPVATATAERDWRRDASPEMGRAGHRANQASRRGVGSAATLTGTTLLYHVFVNDRSSSWDGPRRDDVRRRLDGALQFIAREALRYQQRPRFVQQTVGPIKVDEEASARPEATSGFTERAVRAATGMAADQLVQRCRKESAVDNVLILLHLNKSGRSYNISYYSGVPVQFSAERLVLFAQFSPRQQTPPATYAHEILHGFGAGDLYFPFDTDSRRYLCAKELFPDDVMLRISSRLDLLRVDAWTAYRVGWLPKLRPELTILEDSR